MGKDLAFSALLDVYGRFLSQKQKSLTEHYYNEDLSLGEIAENEGITRQGVNDFIKRAKAQLYKMEEDCGYCEKFLKLRALADNLKSGDEAAKAEMIEIIENI